MLLVTEEKKLTNKQQLETAAVKIEQNILREETQHLVPPMGSWNIQVLYKIVVYFLFLLVCPILSKPLKMEKCK